MNTTPTPDPTTDLGILARLGVEGIGAEIENTGGGVMVVTVQANPAHGVVAVTYDGDAYMVGTYPGSTWHDGESEEMAAHRRTPDADGMVADVRSGLAFLAAARALTPAQIVQASIAWQYRTTVEEPAGYVQLSVPGGVILVSVDHPRGVYGGFYLTLPDGQHGDRPSPVMTGRGPLTFTNAGVWDVDRIVSALRGEHGNILSAFRILADYMA